MTRQTIFALSSGAPPAAIALIRLSGPDALDALRRLSDRAAPAPRRAALRTLRDPASGEPLDEVLVLVFEAERSATGEPVVELHCHGGRAVVAAILTVLGRMTGLCAAEPGEFTRRALESGRLDLNAVEGLSDLLQAETETQRRRAMAMFGGAFTAAVEAFTTRALGLAAEVEAAIDFSDEGEVSEDGIGSAVHAGIESLADAICAALAAPPAERLRDGIRLVIAGPVNSGKSTLLNRLVGRDVAIVTDIAGTTRDRIEVPVAIGGIAWLVTDTAGFRDTGADAVERIGMARAREAIDAAEVLLWLGEPDAAPRTDAVLVLPQIDRVGATVVRRHDVAISAKTGAGMTDLHALLDRRAAALLPAEHAYLLSGRQRDGLATALEALRDAGTEPDILLIAEHLRRALSAFDRLTGRAATEDMLDALFAGFCIGK